MLVDYKKLYINVFLTYCFFNVTSFIFAYEFYSNFIFYFFIFFSFVFLCFNLFVKKDGLKIPINFIHIFLIIIFLLTINFIYSRYFDNIYDYRGRYSLDYIFSFSLGISAWLVVGASSFFVFKKTKWAFFILAAVVVLFLVKLKGFGVINHGSVTLEKGAYYTHLISSTYIFYIIFMCHVVLKNSLNYILIFFSGLILYMTGGRADLIIYFLTIISYGFFVERGKNFLIGCFLGSIIGLFLFIFLSSLVNDNLSADTIRMLNVLTFSNDDSYVERNIFFEESFEDLFGFIVISDPNYLILKYNDLGKYIHNIFSLWQFYGFVFFSYIVGLILLILNKIVLVRDKKDPAFLFGFFLFIFSLLSVLFAKSIFYYPFWFSIGYLLMFFSFHKLVE